MTQAGQPAGTTPMAEVQADVAEQVYTGRRLTLSLGPLGLVVRPRHGQPRQIWWEEVRRVDWPEHGRARLWLAHGQLELDGSIERLHDLIATIEFAAAQVRQRWRERPLGGAKLVRWFGAEVWPVVLVVDQPVVERTYRRVLRGLAWALLTLSLATLGVLGASVAQLAAVFLLTADLGSARPQYRLALGVGLAVAVTAWPLVRGSWLRLRRAWREFRGADHDDVRVRRHVVPLGRSTMCIGETELAVADRVFGWDTLRGVKVLEGPARVLVEPADGEPLGFIIRGPRARRAWWAFGLLSDLTRRGFHGGDEPPPAAALSLAPPRAPVSPEQRGVSFAPRAGTEASHAED